MTYRVTDIEATARREVGYTKTALGADEIQMLDGGGALVEGGKVYIFVSNPESISASGEPTPTFPMVQSYVDLCINGCLEIDALYRLANPSLAQEFTREFIRTTTSWNKNWVNDRLYPRRPFVYCPTAGAIDQVLDTENLLHYVQLHDLG